MKDIETLMTEAGVNLADEAKETFTKAFNENYKTIAEVEKKDSKIKSLTEKVSLLEEGLKKFDGVDLEANKKQIADLQQALADKDAQYSKDLADRDFDALLNESITKANGLNSKAIKALLDIDALKASKNQSADVASAIENLSKAEDSKMLFAQKSEGGRNPIGSFTRTATQTTSRDDKYANNPYYKK